MKLRVTFKSNADPLDIDASLLGFVKPDIIAGIEVLSRSTEPLPTKTKLLELRIKVAGGMEFWMPADSDGELGESAMDILRERNDIVEVRIVERAYPNDQPEKPPLGAAPEHIRLEQRNVELGDAIVRHFEERCQRLPNHLHEWFLEYARNSNRLKEIYKENPDTKPSQ